MSLIKANAVQVGQSPTATQNFTLAVPSSPDGTIKLARGNAGATTQDVLSVDASGNINGLVKATGSTTARSLANRFADVVNVKDFGAVGDGIADDTAAIQAAINAANTVGGKSVFFPAGDYSVTSTITSSSTKQLLIYGEGLYRSRIIWNSPTPGICWNAGVWGLDAQDIQIRGGSVSPTTLWRNGDIGIQTSGILAFNNVRVLGFQKLMKWAAGFYHRFDNCIFDRGDEIFADIGEVYNLTFSQCKFDTFRNGITYLGGSGPISFVQCVFELWTGIICASSVGAAPAITFHGCYFENYPTEATISPMAPGFYDKGIVSYRPGNITFTGCNISVKGIKYVVFSDGGTIENLVSIGNRINYATGAQTTCDIVYDAGFLNSGIFNDTMLVGLTDTSGTFTTKYFGGIVVNPTRVSGFNALTGANISSASYQDGAWTVQFFDAASGGNVSSTTATGNFTKIGKQVVASFFVPSINTTGLTAGNVLYFSLPNFAAGSSTSGSVIANSITFPVGTTALASFVSAAFTRGNLRAYGSATTSVNLTVNTISSGVTSLFVQLTYLTA